MGYDRESPEYLIYYPDVNKVERVRCVKFQGQNFSQTGIEVGGEYLSTPVQRVETEPCIEQTDQANEDENITENNDNVPEGQGTPLELETSPNISRGMF